MFNHLNNKQNFYQADALSTTLSGVVLYKLLRYMQQDQIKWEDLGIFAIYRCDNVYKESIPINIASETPFEVLFGYRHFLDKNHEFILSFYNLDVRNKFEETVLVNVEKDTPLKFTNTNVDLYPKNINKSDTNPMVVTNNNTVKDSEIAQLLNKTEIFPTASILPTVQVFPSVSKKTKKSIDSEINPDFIQYEYNSSIAKMSYTKTTTSPSKSRPNTSKITNFFSPPKKNQNEPNFHSSSTLFYDIQSTPCTRPNKKTKTTDEDSDPTNQFHKPSKDT